MSGTSTDKQVIRKVQLFVAIPGEEKMIRSVVLLFLSLCMALPVFSADRPAPAIPVVPAPLEWQNTPLDWKVEGGKLSITAGKRTDWFVSPIDGMRRENSPRLLFQPANDFVLSAKVTVPSHSMWDAGVLALYSNDNTWAKLCFERLAEGSPTIVSVVTRTFSDDNNHFSLHANSVYLKVAKAGQVIAFYASGDGKKWHVVRAFTFGPDIKMRVGFSSQSPNGQSATAVFEDIRYAAKLINIWTGE
jgi:hypothetical protein